MIGEIALIAIDALDKLSRCRALTELESWNLHRLITIQSKSDAGAARLDAWQRDGLVKAMHIPEGCPIPEPEDDEDA